MIKSGHYYFGTYMNLFLILLITSTESAHYTHDIDATITYSSELGFDVATIPTFYFSAGSPLAKSLTHIGSSQADLDSFISSNPEYFI
jgi:hypothetical protein